MAKKKLCKLCGKNPAEVPDRNICPGRPIKSVCSSCHAERLKADFMNMFYVFIDAK